MIIGPLPKFHGTRDILVGFMAFSFSDTYQTNGVHFRLTQPDLRELLGVSVKQFA
jgi:hypothetical protein